MSTPSDITYKAQYCNQDVPTKVDTRPHFIPIDMCHLAVMCSNSLLKDVVYIYSLL